MLFQFASLITLLATTYLNPAPRTHLPLSSPTNRSQEILASEIQNGPTRNPNMLGVKLTARAAVVLDKKSGKILFAKDAHERLAEASLTKIMTVIVVLDNRPKVGDIVQVSKNPLKIQMQGADIGLKEGEEISVYNLLRSLLIVSANDTSVALAEYTAGSEEKFVELMNQKARRLGIKDSHFVNTHGLDAENHYSSAYDLATLTRYALDKPIFREIIKTPRFVFKTSVRTHWIKNTNKLLNNTYLNIIGGKTGFTDNAGMCLIEVARGKKGQEIIAVLLASRDQWQEAKGLLDWTFRAYTWK